MQSLKIPILLFNVKKIIIQLQIISICKLPKWLPGLVFTLNWKWAKPARCNCAIQRTGLLRSQKKGKGVQPQFQSSHLRMVAFQPQFQSPHPHTVASRPGERHHGFAVAELQRKQRDTKMKRDVETTHPLLTGELFGLSLPPANL